MAKVETIEKKICSVEGFKVHLLKEDGSNVRSDKKIETQYLAKRKSKDSYTVAQWKMKFKRQFPGYDVEVLFNNGKNARGNVMLCNVRNTYLAA